MRALCFIVFLCEIAIYTCAALLNVCLRPTPVSNTIVQNETYTYALGDEVVYTCPPGHFMIGSSVCPLTGKWPPPTIRCEPISCPFPGQLLNGDTHFTNLKFQSTIRFTCRTGYILRGASSIICRYNGTWSEPSPVCEKVQCPSPEGIQNGILSSADKINFSYQDVVSYDCDKHFTLEGPKVVTCEKTGMWSLKPSCKASCIIPVERARILYQDRKIWLKDLPDRRVQHNDTLSFYCKDKDKECGYSVQTKCLDGTIIMPSCFKEPSAFTYNMRSGSLPSEMKQC